MTGRPQDESGSEQLPDELVWIDTGLDDDVDDSFWDDTEDDYSTGENPNLAWNALLRLVERQYPDYKD